MNSPTPPSLPTSDSVIRITDADAHSPHVDDLLRRQASLRGDTGIARDKGRKWFYQNWFVLMLAGLIAALIGWTIIEPHLNDLPYVEGTIQSLHAPDHFSGLGQITIGNTRYIFVESRSRLLSPKGTWIPQTIDALHVGERVGVYINIPRDQPPVATPADIIKEAMFIVPNAPESNATDNFEKATRDYSFALMLLFPTVAGAVGLFIGAADGIMCRLPRRILIAGSIGLLIGLTGGFIANFMADAIYSGISDWAMRQHGTGAFGLSTTGFLAQMGGRALGWAIAGSAMGLGQGLALRSGKILLYGLLGGILGGLLGGLLFDPVALLISGENNPFAHLSRMIGLAVVGLSVGLMIGIVELLARDAWLRMVAGPLAGKEFLIFKNTMVVGASPKSDIYLFNDQGVAQAHATIRATGDLYEIEATSDVYPLTINSRPVQRSRLRHGDQIGLGRTVFVFQRKRG